MSQPPSPNSHQRVKINNSSIRGQIGQAVRDLLQVQFILFLNRPASKIEREYQNRKALLDKVRNFWIKGVLEKSLYNQVAVDLNLEKRLDAVACPFELDWSTLERKSEKQSEKHQSPSPEKLAFTEKWDLQPSEQLSNLASNMHKDKDTSQTNLNRFRKRLPAGTKVIELFNQLGEGGTLLILGEPGGGKTITLLGLAKELIKQAEQDEKQAIPVVLNLSSWRQNQTIAEWLVQELQEKYQVPRNLGKTWVVDERLLLLLDGLDEVFSDIQNACVSALNSFVQGHGRTRIVVCSRLKDYGVLSNTLKLQIAIFIEALTAEQVDHYLAKTGEQLEGIREAIQANSMLQELVTSPLMLSILTLAYQGASAQDLPQINSKREYLQSLFDAYIERMFYRRQSIPIKYSREESQRWLSWLSQRMLQESQSIFSIERMQPIWLVGQHRSVKNYNIRVYTACLFITLFATIIFILNIILLISIHKTFSTLAIDSGIALIEFTWKLVDLGSNSGAKYNIRYLVVPIVFSIGYILQSTMPIVSKKIANLYIRPTETLKWSWQSFKSSIYFGSHSIKNVIISFTLKRFLHIILKHEEKHISQESKLKSLYGLIRLLEDQHQVYSMGTLTRALLKLNEIRKLSEIKTLDEFISEDLEKDRKIKSLDDLKRELIRAGNIEVIEEEQKLINSAEKITKLRSQDSQSISGDSIAIKFGINIVYFSTWLMAVCLIPIWIPIIILAHFLICSVSSEVEVKTMPNQGIWRSLNYGIMFTALPTIIFGGIGWLVGMPVFLPLGGMLGIIMGLSLGGFASLQHFILRLILCRSGNIPWNYAHFLNYATERIFLQKVGGGYIFVHRLLLEYFATLNS